LRDISLDFKIARKLLFSLLSVVMVIMMAGAADSTLASSVSGEVLCCTQQLDLTIKDQNEPWGSGVSHTWHAANMKPGEEYTFTGSFVGLEAIASGVIDITCSYTVAEENPVAHSDSDPYTNLHPDQMAKYLAITRCIYAGNGWQIDCLTGKLTNTGKLKNKDLPKIANGDIWNLRDADHDGLITFYDLKQNPLTRLPLIHTAHTSVPASDDAHFEISVRFLASAGNWLQGDSLVLAMLYTGQISGGS
jgi:hypothetical protein